ncbi:MAG: acetylglutamate kinase [Euryarchaeota archaeon]|jgi:acetylglutamate kinase|nr:acetylglutamate kinase [Euryarchaeota archaeon]
MSATANPRRILIKFGGNSLSGEGDLDNFVEDLGKLISQGFQLVLVHGGGPEISSEMERRGLAVRKVAGLRITDAAALDVADDVLSNINARVVNALLAAGINAKGVSAAEIGVICDKKAPVQAMENGQAIKVDLGNVGDITHVREAKLRLMLERNEVPVIYPIGADLDGNLYNVNADTVAAFVACSVGAGELILLTDVPGILREGQGTSEVINAISLDNLDELIDGGIITGGMIPKVEACRDALSHGVGAVHMLNGREPHSIVRKLMDAEGIGTTITRG